MPLYLYECAKCGKTIKLLQKEAEAPTCPDCKHKKKKMKRVYGGTVGIKMVHGATGCAKFTGIGTVESSLTREKPNDAFLQDVPKSKMESIMRTLKG
jgi:putative FmdB family regulatory protein